MQNKIWQRIKWGKIMDKVFFEDVEDIFSDIWCNSAECFLHEILWDALDKQGLTTYSNDKEYAMCFLYAHVLQMLCNEFSNMAFDEYCSYDFNPDYEEPLTEAGIGWLYRDVLARENNSNLNECFCTDVSEMFSVLIQKLRHTVADPVFKQLGDALVGKLFYFSVVGRQEPGTEYDEDTDEYIDVDPEPFLTKEEFLKYCQDSECCVWDDLPYYNAMRTWHWLSCHSCALDD